ncbi:MAG: histidine kinase [Pseudomonadota bacterium]|nr:histidine kinase [Pseudomonadota bacterium]
MTASPTPDTAPDAGPDAAPSPFPRTRPLRLAGWAAFFVADLVVRVFVYHDPADALALTLALAPLIFALAQVIAAVYRRLGFAGRLTARSLAWVLGLSGAGGVVVALAGDLLRPPLGIVLPEGLLLEPALSVTFYYFLVYVCWSLACFWAAAERARRIEERRAAQAEADALRAELQRLRLQLDPHFLLNALNGIGEEMRDDPVAASQTMGELTLFLRHSLTAMDRLVMTVDEEVEAISAYLEVQRSRFGDRLRTTVDVETAALGRGIAGFLLQPLVENAVEHGRRAAPRRVGVELRVTGDALRVAIRNTGRLAEAAPEGTRTGIGLANVRARLALHYPGRHHLALEQDGEDVVATLILEGEPRSGS